MTENIVQIVKVPPLTKIENSDFLYVAQIGGYQVVTNKKELDEGDLALFVSVESVMPEEFAKFYGFDKSRVKTVKLRGLYSQGLLLPLTHQYFKENVVFEGDKLGEQLGIVKYMPKIKGTLDNSKPWVSPLYRVYDIESIQHPDYANVFKEGEEVVVTEKVHGTHFSCGYKEGEDGNPEFFYTQRRHRLVEPDNPDYQGEYYKTYGNKYYEPIVKYNLKQVLKNLMEEHNLKEIALRGEIYGHGVQKLLYGLPQNTRDMIVFDMEFGFNNYIDTEKLIEILIFYGLPFAPILYQGPFNYEIIAALAEQDSVVAKTKHISEGVVIKAKHETDLKDKPIIQERKILKFISKRYSLKANPHEEVLDE